MSKQPLVQRTFIYGLQNNDVKSVKLALEAGIDLKNISIPFPQEVDEDRANNSRDNALIPFDLFAINYCSATVIDVLANVMRPNSDFMYQRLAHYLKHKIDGRYAFLRKHLNEKNVNHYFPIQKLCVESADYWSNDDERSSPIKVNLLHIASANLDPEAVKILLELGADPNLKTGAHKNNRNSNRYPAALVVKETPAHGDQSIGVNCLKQLLQAGANLTYQNNKSSLWECVLERFKIPQLKQIIKDYSPKDLATIQELEKRSKTVYAYWLKHHPRQFSSYPLLNDIRRYENREVHFRGESKEIPNFANFFKHKRIKDALQNRYGISSGAFTKDFLEQLVSKNEKQAWINPEALKKADFLKEIYLNSKKPDPSTFLELFSSENLNSSLENADYSEIKPYFKMLRTFFSEYAIKRWLNTKSPSHYNNAIIEDTLDMFQRHRTHFQEKFSKTEGREIESLNHLHDIMSAEIETLDQQDFPLLQEKHFPELKALSTKEFPENYGLKVAGTKHELIRWGTMMDHCIGSASYGETAKNGGCILLAITFEGHPKYAIEICKKEINQVQGYASSRPPLAVMQATVKELLARGLIKKNRHNEAKGWSDE